jgi:hypothetical protein
MEHSSSAEANRFSASQEIHAFYGTRRVITALPVPATCPCHQDMAGPRVADGETAYNTEGSHEYIEQAVADSGQGVVLQLGAGRGADNTLP